MKHQLEAIHKQIARSSGDLSGRLTLGTVTKRDLIRIRDGLKRAVDDLEKLI